MDFYTFLDIFGHRLGTVSSRSFVRTAILGLALLVDYNIEMRNLK